jgi:coenzyme F420-0:L-glutamate ligase/coenzyme F420-1:gamma-L-glutamate ligase
MSAAITLAALPDFPLVWQGDDLASLILDGLARLDTVPRQSDVLVLAQKIVSKAEGRIIALPDVEPTPEALELAELVHKDPRLVSLILSESRRVVRALPGLLIVEHRSGCIMANAGIDQSNVGPQDGVPRVLLLPQDADASAAALARDIETRCGTRPAIVINDSFGRPWRRGTLGVALGSAGLPALLDLRGRPDLFGRHLEASQVGLADEIAAAASLLMGQADEGRPAVLLRGLSWDAPATSASALLRDEQEDQFR